MIYTHSTYTIIVLTVIIILQQADNFCNSIGILQQSALPSKFSNFDRNGSQTPQQQEAGMFCIFKLFNLLCVTNENIVLDYTSLFSSLITRCAKDIDALIESLPNDDSSTDLQVRIIEMG